MAVRVSRQRLEELVQERAAIEPIRTAVPILWALLDAEIDRVGTLVADAKTAAALSCIATGRSAAHHVKRSNGPSVSNGRKRVKLPVPADKYPEYNFVGRLLGPRGITLKNLERDSGCKIMIRGKGSIRKDKEADVRGKPGYEHVFHEPLHVVIEVGDGMDDVTAMRSLNRAKETIERLLVPVPEERDNLKRQQLRDLAILNGTFRGMPNEKGMSLHSSALPAGALLSPAHLPRVPHSAHPLSINAIPKERSAQASCGMDALDSGFSGDNAAASVALDDVQGYSFSESGNALSSDYFTATSQGQGQLALTMFGTSKESTPTLHNDTGFHQRISRGGYPMSSMYNPPVSAPPTVSSSQVHGLDVSSSDANSPPSADPIRTDETTNLTSKLRHLATHEFGGSSSVDDSPESSRSSEEDAAPSAALPAGQGLESMTPQDATSPPRLAHQNSLGPGGYLGQGFYNGAFSNVSSPWAKSSDTSSAFQRYYAPQNGSSPQMLTAPASHVSSLQGNDSH